MWRDSLAPDSLAPDFNFCWRALESVPERVYITDVDNANDT